MSKREEKRPTEDLRCLCGSLVAKIKKEGIELKCRRCKRVALIPFSEKEQIKLERDHSGIFGVDVTFDHSPVERRSGFQPSSRSGGSR